MQIDDSILKSEEKVIMQLRNIYRMHGYSCFKMSKFEEYDLYSRNKEFLVSDSVITFNDTDGKLMALKPDVTLSIVKNSGGEPDGTRRVYYNENVYRVSERTHSYKEIMQTGLECIGNVTAYDLFEVIYLAAVSLGKISDRCVLTVSNLDIVSALLCEIESEQAKAEILACIGEKNAHGIADICRQNGIADKTARILAELTRAYGEPSEVVETIGQLTDSTVVLSALKRLETAANQVKEASGVCVRADLSLTSDMNYYNGLIFKGFVEGIPSGVLSGGQYDRLMEKMGKPAKAVGFAVYLDLLERLKSKKPYDVDVLLLYSPDDDIRAVHECVSRFISEGKSVSAQTAEPQKLSYREKVYLGANGTGERRDG